MRETRSSHVFRWVTIAVLTVFTVVPLYVMITSSVKPLSEVQAAFTWWPQTITFQPFIDMWSTVPLASYFVNSLIVSSAATLISLVIAVFAAYAVSRYRFKGRNVFTTTVLSTQMFPGVLFLLPLFLIFVNINQATGIQLVGTRWGLIITYFTFVLPFSIWMLAGYFDGIPRDLDEAAKVDGSGPMGALWHVVLPAARPGLIAVAIYSFMTSWGEVLFASVMTTDENRTLAVGLQLYSTQTNVYWNQIMAASLVVSIPIVVAFLLLQRNFVAGLTAGAVK
ncbi:carbohydrate ABC transporter membrane protein 2, CUT1 family [Leifsonia sp. 98AMF]|jgi:multiple sugar transport system permease protein|uniref:carbohydrate ABC transporter permease n=1 Tax=Microbacteriaceae TaxID=85023 RepID=UPI00038253FB|nr:MULTISPECIES: carbohydrate ABC transporter permease [Microbacteriaceae]SDH46327.1 carbohydrate ABC transporter membrane protein 2, CUT1 family [Leifsonia sp. 197AMF]SDI91169.1 carbohydrate ABC transporter membrane protein 2, CUT1 family [Leifsonia sp. 466MF]SDJ88728.1 carbohydrate ABC transporter membrane protein 2, CUT1 family [Leifsonia sp. 157MF]SDN94845.1 carbohydrate ABC transporter membrane protein 2, CUT1 family [Leifsonia sp. 509MF]SEN10664.1 carbohydrate ABC transporter membrane pr